MELYISGLGKRLRLAIAVTLTAALLLSSAGCAKDVNPPVIQQSEMPEWAVEGENVELSVSATDDTGVKEIYVQFDSGEKIPLAKVDSQKNGEEVANWKASFKLSPKDYSYSIVARDTANEARKEGKITIYPFDSDGDGIGYRDEIEYGLDPNKPNPIAKYALDKNLGVYLPQLLSLENDGVVDENDKAFVDLVGKYPKAGELVPGIYGQFLLLPDLSLEKYSKIDKNDLVATGKILQLASDPNYKEAFLQMEDTGVPDKRKYCTPLECLLWEAYDNKQLDDLLKNYSLEKILKDAWKSTTTSNKYRSDRWKNFDEVVDRLNSPESVTTYMLDNFSYDNVRLGKMFAGLIGVGGILTPQQMFSEKKGVCVDHSWFACYCLNQNGYRDDIFGHKDSYNYQDVDAATCILDCEPENNANIGHSTCLYIQDGKLHIIDSGNPFGDRDIKGPFKTIEEAADRTLFGWGDYILRDAERAAKKFVKRK